MSCIAQKSIGQLMSLSDMQLNVALLRCEQRDMEGHTSAGKMLLTIMFMTLGV